MYPYKHKTVWTCNEPPLDILYGAKPSNEYKRIIKNIDVIVVSDEFNKQRFISLFGDHDIRINHYGIDYSFFSDGKYNKIPELENSFTLLHVGIVHDMKNQLRSITAVQHLSYQIPNLKLVLAGYLTQPYTNTLLQQISQMGIQDKVIFTGDIERTKLKDYYYNADLLLHPIKTQGGWLAPFEALSCGLLPIVSETAPCANLIKKKNIGVVTSDYESVVRSYIKDPEPYKEIAKRGKEFTKEYMTWDRYCKAMLNIYEELSRR